MSQTQLDLQDLRRLLRESAGIASAADLDGDISDACFEDLGYDSIAIMEVAARITREYRLTIDDEALFKANTPRLLLGLVNGSPQDQ